jgi:carbon-monoxide dehydrogenase iron sulfur subunit
MKNAQAAGCVSLCALFRMTAYPILPVAASGCQQCQDAPCMNVCPVKAISQDEQLGRVSVDYNTCIGCRACVSVCPFGAMSFNSTDRRVLKCDVCDGDPQCVRFCDVKAVDFVEANDVSVKKSRKAAQRVSAAGKQAADLASQL